MTHKTISPILTVLGIVVLFSLGVSPATADLLPPDEDWPRVHEVESGQVVMYQPHIESWEDYKHLVGKAAIQVIPTGKESGTFGAIQLEADTQVNHQTRMVLLENIQVTGLNFPSSSKETVDEANKIADELIAKTHMMVISLDRLIAAMEISKLRHPVIDVNLDPPPIFYSSEPAILIIFIGEPKFETVDKTDLMFAG